MNKERITNREEANKYYKLVNNLIDDYIVKWKVRPKEICKYFENNMQRFLDKTGLSDVDGIKKVVKDVLYHRYHMELDKVISFENFKFISENNLIKPGTPTIQHQKVIADVYHTDLGHINLIDSELHIYKVNDFGKEFEISVFNNTELNTIYVNIENNLINNINKKHLTLYSIDDIDMGISIEIPFTDFISESALRKSIIDRISREDLLKIIGNLIKSDKNLSHTVYKGVHKGYHIWEL